MVIRNIGSKGTSGLREHWVKENIESKRTSVKVNIAKTTSGQIELRVKWNIGSKRT